MLSTGGEMGQSSDSCCCHVQKRNVAI